MDSAAAPQVKPVNEAPVKKSKDRRSEEKSVNGLNSADDKLSAASRKYSEVHEENKKLIAALRQLEKKCGLVQREKDQILLENNKNILIKDKLENLCRELQKQNKAVKDESLQKIREEEEKRKRSQEKLQLSFNEIQTLMAQNNEKNIKLRDDNIDITEKFKSVVEQYEIREKQVDKMAKHMALEAQLAEAKINKANLEVQAEREKMLAEKEKLLLQIQVLQSKCKNMQTNEVILLQQISVCNEKISDFQEILNKRNGVFGDLKGELEKMSKKILKLEKENIDWRQKWEKSHTAILEMAVEKKMRDQNSLVQCRQIAQMQRLCRIMKAERAQLLNSLQEHNIERPPFQQIPEVEIIPPVETTDKIDSMAANCAQLKQNLALLQGELNAYVTKSEKNNEVPLVEDEVIPTEPTKTANPSQKSKPRKSKNKKSKQSAASNDAATAENVPDVPTVATENSEIVPDVTSVVADEANPAEVCVGKVISESDAIIEHVDSVPSNIESAKDLPAPECVNIISNPPDIVSVDIDSKVIEEIENKDVPAASNVVSDVNVEVVNGDVSAPIVNPDKNAIPEEITT